MTISIEPLIYIGIFVGVLFLVEGIYLVAFGKSISLNSKVNRRLDMLDKGATRDAVLDQLRKEMSQHKTTSILPLYAMLADKADRKSVV